MHRILTIFVLLTLSIGCSTRQETFNEVVIIVDGLAYSDRFYFEYGKEPLTHFEQPAILC